MRSSSRLLAAAVASLALAATALTPADDADCRLIRGVETTEDASDDVEVCEATGYLHANPSPIGNLGGPRDEIALPTWDENEPTSPVPSAYAGTGNPVGARPNTWPTFEGTFTGDLDTMQVTLHSFDPYHQNLIGNFALVWELSIDGSVVATYNPADNPQRAPLQPHGDYSKFTFALTGIYDVLDQYFETGPDVEHTIRLSVSNWFGGDGHWVALFDSTDTPSDIAFNPDVADNPFITKFDVNG